MTDHAPTVPEVPEERGRGWDTAWTWRCSCGQQSHSNWRTRQEASRAHREHASAPKAKHD